MDRLDDLYLTRITNVALAVALVMISFTSISQTCAIRTLRSEVDALKIHDKIRSLEFHALYNQCVEGGWIGQDERPDH